MKEAARHIYVMNNIQCLTAGVTTCRKETVLTFCSAEAFKHVILIAIYLSCYMDDSDFWKNGNCAKIIKVKVLGHHNIKTFL